MFVKALVLLSLLALKLMVFFLTSFKVIKAKLGEFRVQVVVKVVVKAVVRVVVKFPIVL